MKPKKLLQLDKEQEEVLLDELRAYMSDELNMDIGNLPAKFLLDFMVELIGPKIYDQAISDTEPWLYDRFTGILEDLSVLKKD
ncbi:DUF2164 domain-containing protein [Psychrobacter sanguinis]|uniref:DUF2164 domain-containing protein n=1 Tax=Psychrobacter sanguinis TaxID=861445 RepID=UPI00020C9C21|nr:DUF2164 domain-containing protein [Psychrobacter sanguinis]EGK08130.1 hypothetical protein HMPREF9373_2417 [Psychrobacter sp. 1501(2011)]MCD9152110.1 DUF2164 domain-containing protein [Psychrobacter sanguinis]HBH33340.1 DUF2164 domain-containing protein [Psychrobacter sp.]